MAPTPVSRPAAEANLGTVERIGTAMLGAALLVPALARPSLGRIALAAGGLALLQRGLGGHCPLYAALGVSTAPRSEPRREAECDAVACASKDSFPASDPPSWTPVEGSVARR